MADRPNIVVPIAMLATGAAAVHASLGLIVNLELNQIGYGFGAIAAGLIIAGLALFFAPRALALLAHWIGVGIAGIGALWAATSSYRPRTLEPAFVITSVLAIALLWSAWYALQWWLGGNPSRFLIRMGIGYIVAAAAFIAYIPFELAEDIELFLVDDAISAVALALAGAFLVAYGKKKAPPPQPKSDD